MPSGYDAPTRRITSADEDRFVWLTDEEAQSLKERAPQTPVWQSQVHLLLDGCSSALYGTGALARFRSEASFIRNRGNITALVIPEADYLKLFSDPEWGEVCP